MNYKETAKGILEHVGGVEIYQICHIVQHV